MVRSSVSPAITVFANSIWERQRWATIDWIPVGVLGWPWQRAHRVGLLSSLCECKRQLKRAEQPVRWAQTGAPASQVAQIPLTLQSELLQLFQGQRHKIHPHAPGENKNPLLKKAGSPITKLWETSTLSQICQVQKRAQIFFLGPQWKPRRGLGNKESWFAVCRTSLETNACNARRHLCRQGSSFSEE